MISYNLFHYSSKTKINKRSFLFQRLSGRLYYFSLLFKGFKAKRTKLTKELIFRVCETSQELSSATVANLSRITQKQPYIRANNSTKIFDPRRPRSARNITWSSSLICKWTFCFLKWLSETRYSAQEKLKMKQVS